MNLNFIKPSYYIHRLPDMNCQQQVFLHLEMIGGDCCEATKLNTPEYMQYISSNFNERHHILGHLVPVFSVSREIYNDIVKYKIDNKCSNTIDIIDALKRINATYWEGATDSRLKYIVSGPLEAFIKIWKSESVGFDNSNGFMKLCHWIAITYPELMRNENNRHLVAHDKIQYLSKSMIESLPNNLRMFHEQMTVMLAVDNVAATYIMNNRSKFSTASIAEYRNSGKWACTFVVPTPFNDNIKNILLNRNYLKDIINGTDTHNLDSKIVDWVLFHNAVSETYDKLKCLTNPKALLPGSAETDIILTMQLGEWIEFLQYHCMNSHNEQANSLMKELLAELIHSKPEIFKEFVYLCATR